MASTKVLNAAVVGTTSGPHAIVGTSAFVRCDSGGVNVLLEGVVFDTVQAYEGKVITVSPGDSITLYATLPGTTAWFGNV